MTSRVSTWAAEHVMVPFAEMGNLEEEWAGFGITDHLSLIYTAYNTCSSS